MACDPMLIELQAAALAITAREREGGTAKTKPLIFFAGRTRDRAAPTPTKLNFGSVVDPEPRTPANDTLQPTLGSVGISPTLVAGEELN